MKKSRGRKSGNVHSAKTKRSGPHPSKIARTHGMNDRESEPSGIQVQKKLHSSIMVVGVGGSAGGLEAFKDLLGALPADLGMAFVFMQHLDPKAASNLAEILSRYTKMPVVTVEDDMSIEPNHVYVMPPNTTVTVAADILKLGPRSSERGIPMPIDRFLRSLAEVKREYAVAIVLSGLGSDGALGIKAVNSEGGLTFAQDQNSAQYPSMPAHAAATGCIDFVLPPNKIAAELVKLSRHPLMAHSRKNQKHDFLPEGQTHLEKIFYLLRKRCGVDFSNYKQTTIRRRIQRRMVLNKMKSWDEYETYLRRNPPEAEALFNDILIRVTSFFRDPKAFEFLKDKVFPDLMKKRSADEPIRIWTVGCATGEEAYSLIITLLEFLGDTANNSEIQVFATDISEKAIEKAREGSFPENIVANVSPERLRRFFVKSDSGYQIRKNIRDKCVFAIHNVIKDPPFSRQDLICCRNLLIYLEPILQKKVIPALHYALKPNGFLMLGASETVGEFNAYFSILDKKLKLYSKRADRTPHFFEPFQHTSEGVKPITGKGTKIEPGITGDREILRKADLLIANRLAPPCVVLNGNLNILQVRGDTSHFLVTPPGVPSFNLIKMARPELRAPLRSLINSVKKSNSNESRDGISVKINGDTVSFRIEVLTLGAQPSTREHFVVAFTESPLPTESKPRTINKAAPNILKEKDGEIKRLKQELFESTEHLQSTVEAYESSNEELKSSSEEILSSNEELQSTNEELQTAKEEIQSTNEELSTLNEELENRNFELSQANDDLNNLLISTRIPVVMLGKDLHIRRFTPKAQGLLNLIPTDVGRPISNINSTVNIPKLSEVVTEVIESMAPREEDVQDKDGNWYSMQVRPYRTSDDKIDGAVVTFVDVTGRKQSEVENKYIAKFSQENPSPVLRTDLDGHLLYGNPPGMGVLKEMAWAADSPVPNALLLPLKRALEKKGRDEFDLECEGRTFSFVVVPVPDAGYANFYGSDTTERKLAEELAAAASAAKSQFLANVSHEFRTPLTAILGFSEILCDPDLSEADRKDYANQIYYGGTHLKALIDDVLDLSRIEAEKLEIENCEFSLVQLIRELVQYLGNEARQKGLLFDVVAESPIPRSVSGDATRLRQILMNLIGNAIKFSSTGIIAVKINHIHSSKKDGSSLEFVVSDSGCGIEEGLQRKLFEPFVHGGKGSGGRASGVGLGLCLSRKLAVAMSGNVTLVKSLPNRGSTFLITVSAPVVGKDFLSPVQFKEEIITADSQWLGLERDALKGLSVLVAEDEPEARGLIEQFLRISGADAEFAENGREAVAKFLAGKYDIILMDIQMPEMDGLQATRFLREKGHQVPILALTARVMTSDRQDCVKAGCNDCLAKPFTYVKFIGTVKRLVKQPD